MCACAVLYVGKTLALFSRELGGSMPSRWSLKWRIFKFVTEKVEFCLTELPLPLYDVRTDVLFSMIKVQCERI